MVGASRRMGGSVTWVSARELLGAFGFDAFAHTARGATTPGLPDRVHPCRSLPLGLPRL